MLTFNKKPNDRAEIMLYGPIGQSFWEDGTTAAQFIKAVRSAGDVKTIDLRINSEGGVIHEAQAMYSVLNEHKAKKHVYIDGMAASAASFLAMVGDKITISEGAYVMIHNARGFCMGEAEEMERMAVTLKSYNESISKKYSDRTKQPISDIMAWMNEEKWFDSSECVKYGFVDYVSENAKAVACVGKLSKCYNNMPKSLRPNNVKALSIFERMHKNA
ncbi:MAG: head maturation protease, ClpP-related [Candidatus Paceibacterota bacterium]|jgi:ATP-dependent protease ClpP protease subunit